MNIGYYASIWGLNTVDLLSASRKKNLVAGRAILFFLERRNGITLKAIGQRYNRHHATVLHSIKKVENMYQSHDKLMIDMYETVKNKNACGKYTPYNAAMGNGHTKCEKAVLSTPAQFITSRPRKRLHRGGVQKHS